MLSLLLILLLGTADCLLVKESQQSPSGNTLLVDLTAHILPEALKAQDGSVTSTKRVSFSTDNEWHTLFASSAEESMSVDPFLLSHVTDYGYGELTENSLLTRVSKLTFSCLCMDNQCTKAVAADRRGIRNPNLGIHRQTSPLLLYTPETGSPLPCLSLQTPIHMDEAIVNGCSLA